MQDIWLVASFRFKFFICNLFLRLPDHSAEPRARQCRTPRHRARNAASGWTGPTLLINCGAYGPSLEVAFAQHHRHFGSRTLGGAANWWGKFSDPSSFAVV